jgi:RNA polymerase sigma-70 factor, ECF subfamily
MPDAGVHLSDQALMRRVQAGETALFSEVVHRYERALRRVAASRLGQAEWAEDAVQETFLAAYKGRHTYQPDKSFRTWLWTILFNQCRRSWSGQARRPRVLNWGDQAAESVVPAIYQASLQRGGEPPWARLMARERAGLLETLLGQLPLAQADALRLRFFGELKFDEIADTMGCSLLTAKNRVKLGLLRLAELARQAESVQQ